MNNLFSQTCDTCFKGLNGPLCLLLSVESAGPQAAYFGSLKDVEGFCCKFLLYASLLPSHNRSWRRKPCPLATTLCRTSSSFCALPFCTCLLASLVQTCGLAAIQVLRAGLGSCCQAGIALPGAAVNQQQACY